MSSGDKVSAGVGISSRDLATAPILTGAFAENGSRGIKNAMDEMKPKGECKFRLLDLPNELVNRVVYFAMTPGEGPLELPFHAKTRLTAKVAVGLLRINHQFYHEAREMLYRNDFTFSGNGSELAMVNRSVGRSICPNIGCKINLRFLNNVTFKVGGSIAGPAGLQLASFGRALILLPTPMPIKNLTLELGPYSFRSDGELEAFSIAMNSIDVQESLFIKGLDVHLELAIRTIPHDFGMNLQPKKFDVRHRGPDEVGSFYSHYTLTQHPSETTLYAGRVLNDPKSVYEAYWAQDDSDFPEHLQKDLAQARVNGLDYVTDFYMFYHISI